MQSRTKSFEDAYINNEGKSELIERWKLQNPYYYQSGDGIFRNDSQLGRKYKMYRFKKKFPNDFYVCKNHVSDGWKPFFTDMDYKMLKDEHQNLVFTQKYNSCEWIKFYGLVDCNFYNRGIRKDIVINIKNKPCVNCGTTHDIECDHKNDLYLENEHRLLDKSKQTLNDFQPLCKHCNIIKREVKRKMLKENKRQPAPGFLILFTEGSETLNREDPNWWKGTYWNDVKAFKEKLKL